MLQSCKLFIKCATAISMELWPEIHSVVAIGTTEADTTRSVNVINTVRSESLSFPLF